LAVLFLNVLSGAGFEFRGFGHRATLTLFTREGHRGPYTFTDEVHQTGDNAFVWINTSARQYFTSIARPRPTRNLLWSVAVFLIVCNCVI